jgi:integrase
LLQELPDHLARLVLFKINTGCREQEVCRLRWDWEVEVPELNARGFYIPCEHVKNGEERLVVLNAIAKSVIENERGKHGEFVFSYKGNPVTTLYNSAWKRVHEKVGLPQVPEGTRPARARSTPTVGRWFALC